jgi:hypothetical protein
MKLSAAGLAAFPVLAVIALAEAAPASAEVTRATDLGFVSRNEVVVSASPKDVWLALISPAGWWQSEHTWSGDAKNLTLMPQAGGCFCETIPEVDEPGRFTLQGSVEHMRVVQAYPESALRMIGSLGPLQSEPVNGVLTIVISKVPKGTRIVFEYNVGGTMRYEIPVISRAVDGVMAAQLAALAKPLGVVAMPAAEPRPVPPPAEEAAPTGPVTGPAAAGQGGAKPAGAPAMGPVIKPPAVPGKSPPALTAKPAPPPAVPSPAPKPAPKSPSVDEAFGDLKDGRPR